MALVRGVAAVTVDNPDANGRIVTQGYGYTWRFRGKDERCYERTTELEPVWDYYGGFTDETEDGATGTVDSATHSTIVDAARTEADNYWNGRTLKVTSGDCSGQTSPITDFAHSTGTLTLGYALSDIPEAGDTYEIVARTGVEYEATEYIPVLDAVAPRGRFLHQNLSLSNWEEKHGTWTAIRMPGAPSRTALWWPGAGANSYGVIASNAYYPPAVGFTIQYAAPHPEQTDDAYLLIALWPIGTDDDPQPYWYGYYFPVGTTETTANRYPQLRMAEKGGSTYEVLDEWQRGTMRGQALDTGYNATHLTIENTAGHLLLNADWSDDPWVYRPAGGLTLPDNCQVQFESFGCAAMFYVAAITYPERTSAIPYAAFDCNVGTLFNPTHQYHWLHDTPASTDCAVEVVSRYTKGNPSSREVDAPVVKLTSDGSRRPVCYAVTQFHDPLFSAARSSADDLSGAGVVMEISGRVDDSWRGATCDIRLRITPDQYVWKGNNKVTVNAGWAELAEGATQHTATLSRQFTGYIVNQKRSKQADELGRVYLDLHCEDGIGARLQDKKYMLNHAAYAGVNSVTAITHLLNRCGIPNSLINLAQMPSIALPTANRKGDLFFDYAADEQVLTALDKIAATFMAANSYYYFGVNANGTYGVFLRPLYAGSVDFTLDEDTTTESDFIYELTAERGFDEFRNYVAAIVGRGAYTTNALWCDQTSHMTTSAADFMGDDWWEVIIDADSDNATLLAFQRFTEVVKRGQVIRWDTPGKKDLWPEDFVKVQAAGFDIPTDTVFRIISKDWRLEVNSGEYTTSFLGVKIQ